MSHCHGNNCASPFPLCFVYLSAASPSTLLSDSQVLTALAFKYFEEQAVDVAVVEVRVVANTEPRKENEVAVMDAGSSPFGRPLHSLLESAFRREHLRWWSRLIRVHGSILLVPPVQVGLGGSTDATNVIPPSSLLASVITEIGLDHVDALGGSLRSITEAKAGIIKPSRPVRT